MKRNIDLTENMMFSRHGSLDRITNLDSITWSMITGERIPWRVDVRQVNSQDEFDLEHQRKSVIALGDKKKRAEIKLLRDMDSMNYCDRCGERLDVIPWDLQIGLCKRCSEEFEKEFDDKCKWRIKEKIRNAVIRIR